MKASAAAIITESNDHVELEVLLFCYLQSAFEARDLRIETAVGCVGSFDFVYVSLAFLLVHCLPPLA